jgi:lysophospholipase L1-like esterase
VSLTLGLTRSLTQGLSGPLNATESTQIIRSIAFVGGSTVEYIQDVNATATYLSARGFAHWASVAAGQRWKLAWDGLSCASRFGTIGFVNSQILAIHIPRVIANRPDLTLLYCGLNDLAAGTSAATIASGIQSQIQTLKAAGLTVAVMLIGPRNDATYASNLDAANTAIITVCNTEKVKYFDPNPYVRDSGTGQFKTAMSSDGVHFTPYGAQVVGNALGPWINSNFTTPAKPSYVSSLLGLNPTFTGGTTLATGWSTTGLVTASKVSASDGGNNWQQIVHAPSARTDFFTLAYAATTIPAGISPGDIIEVMAEIEVDSGHAAWTVAGKATFNGTGIQSVGFGYGGADPGAGVSCPIPSNGIYRSSRMVVPADATTVAMEFTANGAGTFRIRNFGIVKLLSAAVAPASGPLFRVNFNDGNYLVARGAFSGGDDPHTYWNNISGATPSAAPTTTTLKTIHNLTTASTFTKTNFVGLTNALGLFSGSTVAFPGKAMQSNWYGDNSNLGLAGKFTGLDPTKFYTVVAMGSRGAVGDNRETRYTVTGATTKSADLDAALNSDKVAVVSQIKPNASGELLVTCNKGPNNNNASGIYHLCFIQLFLDP